MPPRLETDNRLPDGHVDPPRAKHGIFHPGGAIKDFIAHQSEARALRAFSTALDHISSRPTISDSQGADAIHRLIYHDGKIDFDRIELFLKELGHDAATTVYDWENNQPEGRYEAAITRNFIALCRTEAHSPHSSHDLASNFGIRVFGRIPPEVSREQHETQDDRTRPHGAVYFPKEDLVGFTYRNPLADLYQQLNGDAPPEDHTIIRINEVGSVQEFKDALARNHEKYGPDEIDGHKMSFLILDMHGNKDLVKTGEGYDDASLLTSKNLQEDAPFWRQVGEMLEEGAPIITYGCSNGAGDDGFAQHLSDATGRTVIAPDNDNSFHDYSLTATKDSENGLSFDVNYTIANTKVFTPNQTSPDPKDASPHEKEPEPDNAQVNDPAATENVPGDNTHDTPGNQVEDPQDRDPDPSQPDREEEQQPHQQPQEVFSQEEPTGEVQVKKTEIPEETFSFEGTEALSTTSDLTLNTIDNNLLEPTQLNIEPGAFEPDPGGDVEDISPSVDGSYE